MAKTSKVASTKLADLLVCPSCGIEMQGADVCRSCQLKIPYIGHIPVLFEAPQDALSFWSVRARSFLDQIKIEADQIEDLERQVGGLTKTRLQLIREGKRRLRLAWEEVLLPLLSVRMGNFALESLRLPHPVSMNLLGYYANVLRDWAWGEAENEVACKLVAKAIGSTSKLLVLGAGASRLAFDVHQTLGTKLTLAMDVNPALLLVADHIFSGRNLKLPEFPIQAVQLDKVVVDSTLVARAKPDGFHLIMADATRPPVQAGAWETVLTPWFFDIVPETPHELLGEISRALGMGGRWVYFGSVHFHYRDPRLNLSREELIALAQEFGLELIQQASVEIPYMNSPSSAQRRNEIVWVASFEKRREVSSVRGPKKWQPEWLQQTNQSIPLDPLWKSWATSHAVFAEVFGLIDGQRSIEQIGKLLAQRYGASQSDMAASVRAFLLRFIEDSQFQGLS